jgi:hypothetical protein
LAPPSSTAAATLEFTIAFDLEVNFDLFHILPLRTVEITLVHLKIVRTETDLIREHLRTHNPR